MTNDLQAVQMLDEAWNRAYAENDGATLARVLADEWIAVNAAGHVMTKEHMLAQVSTVPWPFITYTFTEVETRVYGTTALVSGRLIGSGQSAAQAVAVDQRYLRVYIKREDAWQAVATHVTPILPQQ